jgi:hypothetical protein
VRRGSWRRGLTAKDANERKGRRGCQVATATRRLSGWRGESARNSSGPLTGFGSLGAGCSGSASTRLRGASSSLATSA